MADIIKISDYRRGRPLRPSVAIRMPEPKKAVPARKPDEIGECPCCGYSTALYHTCFSGWGWTLACDHCGGGDAA